MMKYISLITDVFFWERNSPSLFTLPFFQHIFIMCKCYFWTENIIYFFFLSGKQVLSEFVFPPYICIVSQGLERLHCVHTYTHSKNSLYKLFKMITHFYIQINTNTKRGSILIKYLPCSG